MEKGFEKGLWERDMRKGKEMDTEKYKETWVREREKFGKKSNI